MTEELTSISIARKYFSALEKEGYTFYSNFDRPISEEKLAKIREEIKGEERFWDGKCFILTGRIYANEKLRARWANGTIDPTFQPVLAEYKQVKKKKHRKI